MAAFKSTSEVHEALGETSKAIQKLLDQYWDASAGRLLPSRLRDGMVAAGLPEGKAAEEEHVIRHHVTELKGCLDNALWYVREIGGELTGVSHEVRARQSGGSDSFKL